MIDRFHANFEHEPPRFRAEAGGSPARFQPDDRVHDESAWPATLNMLIERARLSRAEFCRRMGVDSGQGHRWCVDGQKPGFDTLRKMCSVLECTADELLADLTDAMGRSPLAVEKCLDCPCYHQSASYRHCMLDPEQRTPEIYASLEGPRPEWCRLPVLLVGLPRAL